MFRRSALLLLISALLITGCVSNTAKRDPLKTSEGREQAVLAYVDLGKGYLRSGNPERAKEPLRSALEIAPDHPEALEALALVFQFEQEPELAEGYYRRALSKSSEPRILYNYGGFLYEQKRFSEAYAQFLKASADTLYSGRSAVFESLGITALRMGNTDEAKKLLKKSLRLNRNQPRALLELTELSVAAKDYLPARDYYKLYTRLTDQQDARSLWLGIQLARVFDDRDTEASYGLQLKRLFPASNEYQQYRQTGGR
ncbi:type IV pilus assembly protein PilF [Atopomonas hussainii]|uniref:Type IV pilus assembly protein PilF n=1 Tax=Atopomonas hussainii TaxID=1429083 RepID=A0A1H7JTL5_9GAMM|nr:type IV pilus biogenesis/stability protein PilW [Atopomonas hussainii]SEK77862.1 type IV pilus assembly protein PilF [Atopomonas hussainii]